MSNWDSWPQELPSSWAAKPLRSVAEYKVSNVDKVPSDDEVPVRLCNYTDVYNNEFISPELELMNSTATPEEIAKFGLRVGDVIITKDSESWEDIGIPALVTGTAENFVCGYHLALLRPNPHRLDGRFLLRCLQAKAIRLFLELAANGITRYGIPKDEIGKLPIPVPPVDIQTRLADHLDQETTQIDSLIAEKKKLLELVAEKRRVLISHAVTRGLDPNAPLRDSGIPWLGQFPKHWSTRRNAFLFRERDQRGEPELPLLEVSINQGVILREFSDDKIESTAADFNTYKVAKKGDIVFNKMRMWQGAVGVAPVDGLTSPDYTVAEPTGMMMVEYAIILFRTAIFSAECARHSNGIVWDRLRLYWEGFRDIWVPLPPPEDQRAIVSYIGTETAKLDKLRATAERTISLLKERRAALIADVVTGRLDVG